jgi:hypothetical protein
MTSLIGMAHSFRAYTPEAIKKLAPAFAFLSTSNPDRLGQIERAASYAVPILQSGLEIDPMQTLMLGTVLRRAGATSTKSGTWLREMAMRAMPGTTLMSKISFKKHEEALKELGLVDAEHKPTWFDDKGKPDILKMLDIAGARAAAIPIERRAGLERQLFGAQGSGGFALLADPAVRDQILNLQKEMKSPEFQNRYRSFFPDYNKESTAQAARTAMQEFNITMMDLGKTTLPAVNEALKGFKSTPEGIRNLLPSGADGKGAAKVGGYALLGATGGAVAGAAVGMFGGPVGALGGSGGALGVAEQYMAAHAAENRARALEGAERLEREKEGHAAKFGLGSHYNAPAPKATLQPLTLNLNIDGRTLASTVSDSQAALSGFPTQAPAADGMGQFYGGDHNFPSK